MPRYARLAAPGRIHHIISRFVDRRFRLRDEHSRGEYLRRVGEGLERHDWRLLGYALMGSHVHLVAVAGSTGVGEFTRSIHGGFASWINARERRLGPVFASRPTVVTLDDVAAGAVLAYVHNNPVRAGVVADPAASPWTSHRAYVALDEPPPWLRVAAGLELAGFDPSTSGRAAFDAFVRARSDRGRDPVLSGRDVDRSRRMVRRALGSVVEVASPALTDEPRAGLEHVVVRVESAPLRRRWPGRTIDVLRRVSAAANIDAADICGWDRRRAVVRARRLVVMVAVAHLGRTLTEIAGVLGIAIQSASELFHGGGADRAALVRAARAIAEDCWNAPGLETVEVTGTVSGFQVGLPACELPDVTGGWTSIGVR